MKKVALVLVSFLAAICALGASHAIGAQQQDLERWEQQARNVTIVRDDWGIAHVTGKTDADAVFGAIYAQAEDDFKRVELNYINSMGRLAEFEGESALWRDLRMKIFIDPEDMKGQYKASPAWLRALMNAWADGLNFYLAKHPKVTPKVIKYFEPWMALTFSEGSRRRHRESEPQRAPDFLRNRPCGCGGESSRCAPRAGGIERNRHFAVQHGRTSLPAAD
jgi:acyl-homoserine-lactone acylase